MIINVSRASLFQECRTKMSYWDRDRLTAWRTADPLLLGGAYHKGLADFFADGNMTQAIFKAEAYYRGEYEKQEKFILPEEKPLIEKHVRWLASSLAEFGRHYQSSDIQVLQPEVEFCIPLPGTEHHCRYFHNILYPNTPFEQCIGQHGGDETGTPKCWHPHYFRGKTDAVVMWQGKVWLFEHKTEARTGDTYFTRFLLDFQPTGYIYGIQKSTGLRPQGFVLNIIKKPNANFKGDPLSVVGFEREAYLRSDADLDRFARELGIVATDYEQAFWDPSHVYMNTKACTNWNRKCDFHDVCLNHGEVPEEQFARRSMDYVEKQYYTILGMEPPSEPLVQIHGVQSAATEGE